MKLKFGNFEGLRVLKILKATLEMGTFAKIIDFVFIVLFESTTFMIRKMPFFSYHVFTDVIVVKLL